MKKLCIYLSVFLFALLTVQAQENDPHSPRIFGFGTGYYGSVKTLDVSGCPALEYLDCGRNELTSLDVSRNPALEYLDCGRNELTSLDVSRNPALEYLDCDDNELTSLDVSRNPALEYLACSNNELTSLDVSLNPALEGLSVASNGLKTLDVSKNPALESLNCDYNELTSLDVSLNPALEGLSVASNGLMTLDVSKNPLLRFLDCEYNGIPVSVLYDIYNLHPYSSFRVSRLEDSIVLLVGEDFDLSYECRIGQAFSNYNIWNDGDCDYDYDEDGFIFRFNEVGRFGLTIINKEVQSVDYDGSIFWMGLCEFEWHITVLEELPAGYLRLRTVVNKGEWGTAGIRGKGIYKEGEEVTVYATPRRGHRFVNWTRNDGTVFSTEAVHTFTVTEELRLTANFEKDPEDVGNETLAENTPEDGLHVYVRDRTIHLSEERGMVQVYNVAGACVYGGHATAIPVKGSGLYIVRVGERAYKAMVR